jgi:hypothetical protein
MMGYTKTIAGKSRIVTITGVAQSLADLIGEPVDSDANRVILSWVTSSAGSSPAGWISEDPDHTPAEDDGDAIYPGATIEITRDNFNHFKIIRDGNQSFDMWIKQMDFEQDRT